jgi:hypothetical protein
MSHSGNRPQPGNDGSNPSEESGLLSERSLTIIALSSAIAVLAWLSDGLTTGINMLTAPGPGWALATGAECCSPRQRRKDLPPRWPCKSSLPSGQP